MTEMVSELDRDTVTGKKTKVKVTATPLGAAPWVTFAMRADYLNQGGQQDGDELVFDPGAGPFTLTFDLADDTDLDLAFYPQFADAIWVAVGSDCPTGPGDANDMSGTLTRIPIGSLPPRWRRTNASLTMHTGAPPFVSASVKLRPLTIGMPRVSK